jgi:copper chaperone
VNSTRCSSSAENSTTENSTAVNDTAVNDTAENHTAENSTEVNEENIVQTTVNVSGMTCQHCVRSVTEELGELDGVERVDVDLVPGGVSPVVVTASRELGDEEIAEAVEEAGYSIG